MIIKKILTSWISKLSNNLGIKLYFKFSKLINPNTEEIYKVEIKSLMQEVIFDYVYGLFTGILFAISILVSIFIIGVIINIINTYPQVQLVADFYSTRIIGFKYILLLGIIIFGFGYWVLSTIRFFYSISGIKARIKQYNSSESTIINYRKKTLCSSSLNWDDFAYALEMVELYNVFNKEELEQIKQLYLKYDNVTILEYEYFLDSINDGDFTFSPAEIQLKREQFLNTTEPRNGEDSEACLKSLKEKKYITDEEYAIKLIVSKKYSKQVGMSVIKTCSFIILGLFVVYFTVEYLHGRY